jgi:putative transposase
MRKGRFSEEQMIGILREADREPVAQVAKKHCISEQTVYTWRQRFSGMNADEVKRLRQLEHENSRLKKLLAERDLEIEIMKEIAAKKMVSAPARRQQAAFAFRHGLSQRKACALFSLARSVLRYESRMVLRDAPLVALMMALAAQYPRYGYRRIAVFMEREGHKMRPDKAYQLWCARQGSRCRESVRASGLPPPGLGPTRRVLPMKSGHTTSCTTPAPTASRSSA